MLIWRKHGVTISLVTAIVATLLALVFVNRDDMSELHALVEKTEQRQQLLTDSMNNMTKDISGLLGKLKEIEHGHQSSGELSEQANKDVEDYEQQEADRIRQKAKDKLEDLQKYVDEAKAEVLKIIKKDK